MSLQKTALAGIKWSGLSQIWRQILNFVTTAILARILSPSDFGLIGMATIVISFIGIFKDLGTSAAIIQRKNTSESLFHSLFWINLVFGLIATILLCYCSPIFASFYREPRVSLIIKFLSFNLFISGISIIQKTFLEKNLDFNKLAKIEVFAVTVGSLVGIIAAIKNFGVWSLVYQSLAVTTITTILLWLKTPWQPKLIFDPILVKEVSSYSFNLTAFNIFNFFCRNADYLLIGRFLGDQALGYYTLAYRIMLYPLQNISSIIGRVMFPVFSQVQDDDEKFRHLYLKLISITGIIIFPIMAGIFAIAEPFVLTVFGEQWKPVILLLMILTTVGIRQSLGTSVGMIYQAKGRTDIMFRWSLLAGFLIIPAFVIGLQWGIVGVATAYAIATMLLSYPSFAIPFRLIQLPMQDFLSVIWRPFFVSILMLVVIIAVKFLLPIDINNGWMLLILGTAGSISYVLSSLFINQTQIKELFRLIYLK
uniref:MOP flippase family protein n=1 Tax=Planktothricoides sp. SpSt-374 TaxID=2282167 RepID=A0A7C3VMF6_9CYAN